ncbi:MAG: hypothetical protein H0U27_11775 [Nitrosopumilus sp.]|nr:hypothetical protein [Nitrosopumilus sp.]
MISRLNLFSVTQPLNSLSTLHGYDNLICTVSELAANSLSYFVLSNFVQPQREFYFTLNKFLTIAAPTTNHFIRSLTGNEFIARIIFSTATIMGFDSFIHELGHCIADKIENPNPDYPCQIQDYMANTNGISGFISAGGPAAAITSISIKIILSNFSKKDFPRLSLYLGTSALLDLIYHVGYAWSSEKPRCCSHDFEFLWDNGIHPTVAIITMISIPLIAHAMTCNSWKNIT